ERGELDIIEKTTQQYDVKSFEATVPMAALGIGKVTVSFNDTSQQAPIDIEEFWDKEKKLLTSTTQQLHWNYSGKGYTTIDTPGTKGLVGFAPGISHSLGAYKIETENEFAVIFISSLEKDKGLDETSRALITT